MHTAIAVAHVRKLLMCNVPCENLYKVQIFLIKKKNLRTYRLICKKSLIYLC